MLIQSELRVGLCAQSRGDDSFLPVGFILSCTVHLQLFNNNDLVYG